MEPLANPALFSIPLLGHGWLRQTAVDPQVWAQAVCAATPVRICEPQQAGLPFRNDSAVLNLGQVVVVATQGSAITLVTEQHPFAQMLIPIGAGASGRSKTRAMKIRSVNRCFTYRRPP